MIPLRVKKIGRVRTNSPSNNLPWLLDNIRQKLYSDYNFKTPYKAFLVGYEREAGGKTRSS